MSKLQIRRFIKSIDFGRRTSLLNNKDVDMYKKYAYNVLNRFLYNGRRNGNEKLEENGVKKCCDSGARKFSSAIENNTNNLTSFNNKWKPEIAWVAKALEPAFQFYKWALPTGNGDKPPPIDRSIAEIYTSIQKSKLGIKDWSLSDLTIGLYLIYLRQASTNAFEEVKGEIISSESIIHDLIYHTELAKGAYKDNPAALARYSMLREKNIVKFVKNSSVLRPGYYLGVDTRKKLVILGIRGTHTVYDLITDIISLSHEEVLSEGHFGTAEAARWFLTHEVDTIRKCLEQHKGFRVRLVGHSLGGAIASSLAIMLREKSVKELGFSPDIVTAIGYGTPPCVSKELAESCLSFVTTVVLQVFSTFIEIFRPDFSSFGMNGNGRGETRELKDDIIPRLSASSLKRLRNEIVETDWESVFEREEWKGVIDLVANAKQVVSSVQDVARKLGEYAKFTRQAKYSEIPTKDDVSNFHQVSDSSRTSSSLTEPERASESRVSEDLFVPGTVYYLKRNVDAKGHYKPHKYFTLIRRQHGEHFQRILLSNNTISDHRCDSHYYALRDVLKGLPGSLDERIF